MLIENKMRQRNSISYSVQFERDIPQKRNERVLRNILNNNIDKELQYNNDLKKDLNNTYRNYELNLNQKDIKITNNLYNISVNKFFDMKNRLKHSEKLIRQYDNQFEFINAKPLNNFSNISTEKFLLNIKEENSKNNATRKLSETNNNNNNQDENKIENFDSKKKGFEKFTRNNIKLHSVFFDERNNLKKFKKIIINEKKIKERMRKIDQLSKLFNDVDMIEKREAIDDNKFFKVEKNVSLLRFHKDNLTPRKNINSARYRCNLVKKKIKLSSEKDSKLGQNNFSFSPRVNGNNSIINLKNNHWGRKVIFSPISRNGNNLNELSSDKSSINNVKKNYSSFNFDFKQNKTNDIYPSINFTPISKNKFKLSLNSIQRNEERMNPIIYKTIYEGNKINNKIKKNYSLHKHPKERNMIFDILNDDKMDLEKLRNNLKLKDSKGINGSINEIQLMKNNVKKMENLITKKGINIIRSIVKGMIKEDRILHKRLIYNVGLENRMIRQKYLDLFYQLKNFKPKKNNH